MKTRLLYIFILYSTLGFSQDTISELLKKHNSKGIPYISVEELAMPKTDAIILDSREPQEYEVSHIKDAISVGYDNFNIETIEKHIPKRDQEIIVYCSLGIRSEVIANKLKKAGYTKVKNLYGGIFEWKNKNFSIYNTQEKETDSIHTFSKEWSKWLNNGIKIHE
ncbi:rhodanese-like domain-containing protein [Psychroserpens ponticola]|uniref:Rhodanese-like domain-containing protein n=1 Tax=Psychroserpens ponticola TaxID=2932268 RepID=A0ABY7RVQ4_9FLAO|nr:rhodanese-like domain-containing protein [Psychroserpens ponticola]WCO01211.1 rhodanese-like domain-containing protein [Psychroserpens ponticola]